MAEYQIVTEDFSCNKLGSIVSITKTLIIHRKSGNIDKKSRPAIDCDNSLECGVLSKNGDYDWSKCVHPENKR